MQTQSIVQPIIRPVVRSVVDRIRIDAGSAPALPAPTTVNFTAAQFSPGFTGSISTTKNAARIYARGALTLWSGWISGTEAKLTAPSDFGDNAGSLQVAIDGGAFAAAPNTASVYTLFTGLPHATRFVEVRWVEAMGDAPYITSSGNVLVVTGQPPALVTLANKIQVGADSATGLYSGATVANSATYTPALQAPKGETYGSNVGSVKIKGAFTKLIVTLNGNRRIGICKNGAAPVFYSVADESGAPSRAMVIPCDGSVSIYNVWDDGNFKNGGGVFSVAGDSTFLDIGTRLRLDQFGDSVTYGSGPGATSSDTETMSVAAALGRVGSTSGRSGLTIEAAQAFLDSVLAARTISAGDAAVLALGGNNANTGIGDTQKAAYLADINKLKAKGYTKILCRGILPSADPLGKPLIDAANTAMKSVVDALADPNVIWVNTDGWTGWPSQDNAHPDNVGYNPVLANYAAPAYLLLGL